MKNIIFFLAFCLVLFAAGCKTDMPTTVVKPKILDSIEIFTDTTSIDLGWCFDGYLLYKYIDTLVIKDTNDLNIFRNKTKLSGFPLCDTTKLPFIDFDKYILLGRFVAIINDSVCKIYKTIFKHNYEKKFVFFIKTINYTSIADRAGWDMNWLLIPKLQDGWKIEFDSTYQEIHN